MSTTIFIMINNIKQFNSENKSWKIHVNKLISISNDDLIIDTTSENNKIFLLKDTIVKNINVSNMYHLKLILTLFLINK